MSLGFEQAGFDVLAAVDNDPVHLATYSFNFPLAALVCADVSSLDPEAVIGRAREGWTRIQQREAWDGALDCVFGGPSCQGFSSIGKRDPTDERNRLIDVFARLVVALEPRHFVMENVPGILEPQNRKLLERSLNTFRRAGYALVGDGPFLLDAREFGVPQMRKRVFVIGARQGEAVPAIPSGSQTRVTVAEALDDLVDVELYEELLTSDSIRLDAGAQRAMRQAASRYVQQLRGGASHSLASIALQRPRVWDPGLLTSSGRTAHTDAVIKRFMDTPQGGEEGVARLPRLSATGQATTLRAGTGRDHGSFTSARPIHHRFHRVISVREAARLHSFPDWFRFHVSKWHGFRQVGNSVPPALARYVGDVLVTALGRKIRRPARALSLGEEELLGLSLVRAAEYFGMDPALLPLDSRPPRGRNQGERIGQVAK